VLVLKTKMLFGIVGSNPTLSLFTPLHI